MVLANITYIPDYKHWEDAASVVVMLELLVLSEEMGSE
jgi:hypothetical protein